jgi:hypothetical protein
LGALSRQPYSEQTGKPSVDALRGKSMFEWLDGAPEFVAVFNEGMTRASEAEIEPVLAAILRKTPQARGILFDAESVAAGAPAVLDAAGVADSNRRVVLRICAVGW